MEDLAAFPASHPELCDPAHVRVPGLGTLPSLEGARPFPLTADHLAAYRVEVPKDPATLPGMLKQGPEAVAFYASFRLVPDRWGIYIREGRLRALQEEYHRIIWRDLGKYSDRDIADVAERVEYTLVLDYLSATTACTTSWTGPRPSSRRRQGPRSTRPTRRRGTRRRRSP